MLYKYSHSIALSEQRSLQLVGCHCESTGESRNAKTIGPMPLGSAHLGFWAATLKLGGGWFEYFVCSFLLVAMIQFDEYFHQMGGWNHQLVLLCLFFLLRIWGKHVSRKKRRDPRKSPVINICWAGVFLRPVWPGKRWHLDSSLLGPKVLCQGLRLNTRKLYQRWKRWTS